MYVDYCFFGILEIFLWQISFAFLLYCTVKFRKKKLKVLCKFQWCKNSVDLSQCIIHYYQIYYSCLTNQNIVDLSEKAHRFTPFFTSLFCRHFVHFVQIPLISLICLWLYIPNRSQSCLNLYMLWICGVKYPPPPPQQWRRRKKARK